MQFDGRYDFLIDFKELFHEIFTKIGEALAAQKKVRS